MTRWTVVISDETDKALRTYLAQNGGKKGDISLFVEEAVKDRLFHLTVSRIKERNRLYSQQMIMDVVDEAIESTRAICH